MPTTMEASHYLREANVLFAPAKAANAGGVAVSGLEMSQNSMRLSWPMEELERRLEDIMFNIHQQSKRYGQQSDNTIDYVRGSNIAGFTKVAEAMLSYGVV